MAIVIKLTFPAGRYHATPWGRHVNEGVPEWPLSPWRLLRALIAVWQRTCPDLSEQQVRRVLESLLSPPKFHIPPFRVAHTRHYMPLGKSSPKVIKSIQGDPTLVFDTFISISRNVELFVDWPNVEFKAHDRLILGRLLANLSYLGRAESWVHAELFDGTVTGFTIEPSKEEDPNPVPVLCPDPATAFGSQHYPTHDPKKLKKRLNSHDHLFDCPRWHLCLDTETVRERKWSQIPGAKWEMYARPDEQFSSTTDRGRRPMGSSNRYTVARFALDGAVLPLVQNTVIVADQMRRAIMSRYDFALKRAIYGRAIPPDVGHFSSEILSGRDSSRKPLRDDHAHAYYLPSDEDRDGHLDHVTIYAAAGFGTDEVRAIDSIRHLKLGDDELSLLLVGLGRPHDFERSSLFGRSEVWESATPFLATRHPKCRGKKRDRPELLGPENRQLFLAEVLREEWNRLALRSAGHPSSESIEITPSLSVGPRRIRPLQFCRARPKPGDDGGQRPATGLVLRFPEPVFGPICLGHSSHFGLGLFVRSPDPHQPASSTTS
jgi:CRISPR-associated protein Csb2